MKLTKALPAIVAAVVLSACSSAAKMEAEAPKMAEPVKATKTVVYSCNKKTVKAVYQFEDQKAVSADVTIGKLKTGELARTDREDPTFESDAFRWSLDSGFSLDSATKTTPVMLTKKGKKSDQIVVKSCKVVAKATEKANQ